MRATGFSLIELMVVLLIAALVLAAGMTFTIEPMVNAGRHTTKVKRDGWTVETIDGRLSAQWEHTIAVTQDGCEVLTARSEESF